VGFAALVGVPCIVLGVVGGVAFSRSTVSQRPSSRAAEAPQSPSAERTQVFVAGPSTARLADDEREALRALIREEFAAQKAATESRDAGNQDQAPDRAMSSEQVKSYDHARALVEDGVARGAWTEEDRAQLRGMIGALPSEERIEIVRQLIVAVNDKQVRFDGHGPLF
jgi:hypothetical protein